MSMYECINLRQDRFPRVADVASRWCVACKAAWSRSAGGAGDRGRNERDCNPKVRTKNGAIRIACVNRCWASSRDPVIRRLYRRLGARRGHKLTCTGCGSSGCCRSCSSTSFTAMSAATEEFCRFSRLNLLLRAGLPPLTSGVVSSASSVCGGGSVEAARDFSAGVPGRNARIAGTCEATVGAREGRTGAWQGGWSAGVALLPRQRCCTGAPGVAHLRGRSDGGSG